MERLDPAFVLAILERGQEESLGEFAEGADRPAWPDCRVSGRDRRPIGQGTAGSFREALRRDVEAPVEARSEVLPGDHGRELDQLRVAEVDLSLAGASQLSGLAPSLELTCKASGTSTARFTTLPTERLELMLSGAAEAVGTVGASERLAAVEVPHQELEKLVD